MRKKQKPDPMTILCNPMYGYGRWLEPTAVVVDQVLKRNVELAERQKRTGQAMTLEELDAEFTAVLDDLEEDGFCRRMPDLPPLVPKETWLRAQQEFINRLVTGRAL
ncbi:MAG: hypothetical protein PVH17_12095 [Anaerolineae bacterium]